MLRSFLDNLGSVILALVLAVIVWVVAVNEENPSIEDFFGQPIPIEVLNKSEDLVILGKIDDSVKIKVRAPEANWKELKPNKFRAWVDLAGLEAGVHDVDVQVACSDPWVKILEDQKEPRKITIRLEELKEKETAVRPIVLDSAPLGYHIPKPLTVTPDKVRVSGPQTQVDQVTEVVVDVWLGGAKATFERKLKVSARDSHGEAVEWLNITPDSVTVKVPIEQRLGYKDVSVKAVTEGTVASGYWISNIAVEPSTVTVIGNPKVVAEIPGFLETEPINIDNAQANLDERVGFSLPEGVSLLGEQSVLVHIAVTPIEGGQTVQRELIIQGLEPGLSAKPSPETVDVILSGPLPKLEALKMADVSVILNLLGLEPGIHKVEPEVIVPEGIVAESILPSTIEVEVVTTSIPTPTSTPKIPQALTPTPSPPTPTPTTTPAPLPECPNPRARLTYPTVNAVLNGVVQILGSAEIENFDYYKLEFRSQEALEWAFLRRAEEPVADGILGVWDTSSLPTGTYWLRLVVIDVSGNYPEPCQVPVTVVR